MICSTCDKRQDCIALCPDAELYANQDYVSEQNNHCEANTGFDLGQLSNASTFTQWLSKNRSRTIPLSKREIQIFTLLAIGFDRPRICEHIDMTKETLRKHLQNIRKKYSQISL